MMKSAIRIFFILLSVTSLATQAKTDCILSNPSGFESSKTIWISYCSEKKANGYIILDLYNKDHQKIGIFLGEAQNGQIKTGVSELGKNYRAIRYTSDGKVDNSDDHLSYMNSFDTASFAAQDYAKYLDAQGQSELALRYRQKANAFMGN